MKNNRFAFHRIAFKTLLILTGCASVSLFSIQAAISIDLGNNGDISGTDLIGSATVAEPANDWINGTGSADGNITSGSVTVSWNGNFYVSGAGNGTSSVNHTMMNGSMSMNNNGGTFINVTGIGTDLTSNGYDVYVYFANDTTRTNGVRGFDNAANEDTAESGSIGKGYYTTNGYVSGEDYVILRGFTGSEFTLTRGATGGVPQVAGIQVVPTIPIDTTPPAAPAGLVALSSHYKVDLSWTANSEPDLAQYLIYRNEDGGVFRLLASQSGAQYTDRSFSSGVVYSYYVIASDLSKNKSPQSLAVLGSFTPPSAIDVSPSGSKPNIILVMSDDQGWGDTGYNGHAFVQTPSTDAMAAEGYVFNHFYAAAPNCSPTRASVLTGRHPIRTKVSNHGRYMRNQEMTIAEALKKAGYVTGFFGKMHIGSGQPDSPANPSAMGFDEWLIGLNFFDNNPYLSRNGVVEHATGKGSDITIDETIAFIGRHKDGTKPIFALAWFPSPHDPHAEVPDGPTLYSGESQAGYYREITLLDQGLGRLRQYLRDQNIHQNTILWYCSDNGGLNVATTGGRGKKGQIYEGGLRVPGIIEWPGRNLKGSSNTPITTMDMYPTLLAMAGVQVEGQLTLDGADVSSILEGSSNTREAIGFWHNFQGGQSTYSDSILRGIMFKQQAGDPTPHNAGRMKKDIDQFPQYSENSTNGWAAWNKWPWKLHQKSATAYELYNLVTDPNETTNLYNSAEHATVRDTMKAELTAWRASVIRSINGADYGKSSLWLPMNRTEGIEVFDALGPKRGDILNTPNRTSHWIAGKHNQGLILDGLNDQISIENAYYDAPVGANARTISAWVKTTGAGMIASWGSTAGNGRSCTISLSSIGKLSLDVSGGLIVGQSDLRDNLWHHIAVVIPNDGSPNTSEVTLYVDGVPEAPSSITNAAIRTDNSLVKIGGPRSSGSNLSIDEFRISPIALNSNEIISEATATDQAAAAWHLQHYGTTGPIAWGDDTDNDGRNTLNEYALGGDPTVADFSQPQSVAYLNTNADHLEISYSRRKNGTHDLFYEVLASYDLISWNVPVSQKSVVPHPHYDNGLFERVTYETTNPIEQHSRLFMKIKIQP